MDTFIYIFLLVGLATYLGHLAERIKQPRIIGEILAGIIVGPLLLFFASFLFQGGHKIHTFLTAEYASTKLTSLVDFAGIMIMFGAGLETDLSALFSSAKHGFFTALGGVILPFSLGLLLGKYILHLELLPSLYLGAAVSITAVALSVATLIQLKKLNTKVGMTIIVAAVLDDIIGVILLSVIMNMTRAQDTFSLNRILIMVIIAIIFIAFALLLGHFGKKLTKYFRFFMKSPKERLAFFLLFLFLFSIISHLAGLHLVIGAFLAGLILGPFLKRSEKDNLENWIWGLFAPLFFAWVGFSVEFSMQAFGISLLLIVGVAFIGKIVGAGGGALLSGIKPKESLAVGIGMNGRAAVELIIAEIALRNGVINRSLFSAVVFMAILAALSTPLLLRLMSSTITTPVRVVKSGGMKKEKVQASH
jgi:Kef-type K+ transport system membrane component KefB